MSAPMLLRVRPLCVVLALATGVATSLHESAAQALPSPVPLPATAPILAPAPTGWPDHRLTNVLIVGETGALQPQQDRGMFEKVAVRTGQQVQLVLSFAPAAAGLAPEIIPIDGGSVTSAASVARPVLQADGRLPLIFEASQSPGMCRVSIRGVGGDCVVRFWVVSPGQPLPTTSTMLRAYSDAH